MFSYKSFGLVINYHVIGWVIHGVELSKSFFVVSVVHHLLPLFSLSGCVFNWAKDLCVTLNWIILFGFKARGTLFFQFLLSSFQFFNNFFDFFILRLKGLKSFLNERWDLSDLLCVLSKVNTELRLLSKA